MQISSPTRGLLKSGFLRGGDNGRRLCAQRAPCQHTAAEVHARDSRHSDLGDPFASSSPSIPSKPGGAGECHSSHPSEAWQWWGGRRAHPWQRGSQPYLQPGWQPQPQELLLSLRDGAGPGRALGRSGVPGCQERANPAGSPGPEGLPSSCTLVTDAHGHLRQVCFSSASLGLETKA